MVLARKKAVGSEYDYQTPASIIPKKQKKKKQASTPWWLFRVAPGICIIAIIFLIGISLVAQHAFNTNLGYEISKYKQEIIALEVSNDKLKLEMAALASLTHIENVAKNQLGMIEPNDVQYIFPDIKKTDHNQNIQIAGFNTSVSQETPNPSSRSSWIGMVHDFILSGNNNVE